MIRSFEHGVIEGAFLANLHQKRMTEEKRRYERFENHSLNVAVSRPGIRGLIRTNPTADCLNFSRTGLQFDCPQKLEPGENLLIDIEVDDIDIHDIKAEVVTRKETSSGDYCHGVRFCLEDVKRDDVFRALLLIEDKLKGLSTYG